MGTPEFAVPSLDALIRNGHEVVLAVMQKDKPRDRGKEIKLPPVKVYALAAGIPVLQPEKLNREPEMVEAIRQVKPDLVVTCAFGQILPQSLLEIPGYGTINVHGSLLPALRGAAPIQWAILRGERETGITTMYTDIGLDTGDMLLREIVEIPDDMTAGELHDMLSIVGAATLIKTLHALEAGTLHRSHQNDALATYAPRFTKEMGFIDWNKSAWEIYNLIRGTDPWPGAYTRYKGGMMRIVLTEPVPRDAGVPGPAMRSAVSPVASPAVSPAASPAVSPAASPAVSPAASPAVSPVASPAVSPVASPAVSPAVSPVASPAVSQGDQPVPVPGTILSAGPDGLVVQTGNGTLGILEIQMPSSRKMRVINYLNGHSLDIGTVLGAKE